MNLSNHTERIRFLTVKDLQKIYPQLTSYSGAWKAYKRLKDCIGKKEHQKLTVADIATWEGLTIEQITSVLL